MLAISTKRPRNVDAPRAAAILYGDWGTSKAYVLGLAFAIAGYSSFWLIAAMGVLTAFVGINYIIICRHYPEGGGVYASVRRRSEVISIVGAFLLIADYLVTAAISAQSAFEYLALPHPAAWAAFAIAVVGVLNYFGPRHTGGLAFLIAVPTFVVVVIIAALSVPHLGTAVHNLKPLQHGFWPNWNGFVGIVLALSGVEAIANSTGVMKLDPGSTEANPSVSRTATRAILVVMLEVCFFTVFLGLAMHALDLRVFDSNVFGAGDQTQGVRDSMLRYMGEVFSKDLFGLKGAHIFGLVISIVFGFLLFSAVNTAIGALISIQFLMSRDGEMPRDFQRLNSFGVPVVPILIAVAVPMALVLLVHDMVGLADLYAVGVVGAIAANLGSTSTDFHIKLKKWERVLMFCTFLVMLAIEISLFINKPHARVFAATILAVGLVLRGIAKEWEQRRAPKAAPATAVEAEPSATAPDSGIADQEPMLCAVRGIGKTLDFALQEARETRRRLYLLFVREQKVITDQDRNRRWTDDDEAKRIFAYAGDKSRGHPCLFCYTVSDSVADTIVDITATLGVSRLILGTPKRGSLLNILRGNIIQDVARMLPEDIHLLVHS